MSYQTPSHNKDLFERLLNAPLGPPHFQNEFESKCPIFGLPPISRTIPVQLSIIFLSALAWKQGLLENCQEGFVTAGMFMNM